ncbi:hypothetical protein [Pseudomonas lutea]|uniref:Uncharacterized protein n=1 Tax=Pseudomonas lutea TaxID=243924 RepID=A0A9X0EDG0_9PSED|nr:hypothetical protein [Pseudomonas lutea]KGF63648.1 hypothetical protein LT42_17270 [Pseudomonas lutea]
MSILTQGTQLHIRTEFESLGDRLIRFGQALKEPDTTVGQLTSLANSCGIALKLRAIADSGDSNPQQ